MSKVHASPTDGREAQTPLLVPCLPFAGVNTRQSISSNQTTKITPRNAVTTVYTRAHCYTRLDVRVSGVGSPPSRVPAYDYYADDPRPSSVPGFRSPFSAHHGKHAPDFEQLRPFPSSPRLTPRVSALVINVTCLMCRRNDRDAQNCPPGNSNRLPEFFVRRGCRLMRTDSQHNPFFHAIMSLAVVTSRVGDWTPDSQSMLHLNFQPQTPVVLSLYFPRFMWTERRTSGALE